VHSTKHMAFHFVLDKVKVYYEKDFPPHGVVNPTTVKITD
jgi:hypothetical protein